MRLPLPAGFERRASWAYSDAPWFTGLPYVYPQASAAGMYSTAGALARLLIEVQNAYRNTGAKVLTRDSAIEMLRPQALVSEGAYLEYTGAGTFLLELKATRAGDAGRYFGHTGKNVGFVADALGSVAGGNGMVMMLNRDGAGFALLQELRRAVASVYDWPEFLPPAVTPVKVPTGNLDQLAGRFRKGPDEVVIFRREGGTLIQAINGGAEVICVPQGNSRCLLTEFGLMAEFELDENGRARKFRIAGTSQPMPRMADAELLPNALLRAGRIPEGVAAYRDKELDVWQLTYIASDQIERRHYPAARGLLVLALEQFPQAAIVRRNLGILAERQGNREEAILAYRQAVELDSADSDARIRLQGLQAREPRP